MRNAYALLGLAFIIVFGSAYILFERAHAPSPEDIEITKSTSDTLPDDSFTSSMSLTLTSPEFEEGSTIPKLYTCDGENISPPLNITGVPEGTESLILVMDDPDIPMEIKSERGIEKFDHWALYNIPPDTSMISADTDTGTNGLNGRGEEAYTGPCPPTQYEPTEHRYVFRLYAVSGQLNFIKSPTLDELETAAKGMMLGKTELIGRYSRVESGQ